MNGNGLDPMPTQGSHVSSQKEEVKNRMDHCRDYATESEAPAML